MMIVERDGVCGTPYETLGDLKQGEPFTWKDSAHGRRCPRVRTLEGWINIRTWDHMVAEPDHLLSEIIRIDPDDLQIVNE